MEKNEMNDHEKYLSKFTEDSENIEINKYVSDTPSYKDMNSDLTYLSVDIDLLPLKHFYKTGFKIKIRAAKVHEIQAYSVVDDKNILDVTEKMNQLLSSCVKVTLPNGSTGSYKDIKDGDRLFIIFMIRELTFQKGASLSKEVTCEHCNNEFSIPFRSTANQQYPKTFVFYEMPEKINKFYDPNLKCYILSINGVDYKISPPNIGIQEIFYDDLKSKVQNKKQPNVSFLKIIPYLLIDRSTITEEGIKQKEQEFKNMDMYTFQIINQFVDSLKFGIEGLKMKCTECGGEVHTDMSFPSGASSLFVIPDIFDKFIKE
jgi:hypothetical protein